MNLFRQIAAENISLVEFPFISELNIESYIIENPQILSTDDLRNIEIISSQLHIPEGRKTGDGRIDLLAKAENECLIVIEIKKGILEMTHLEQLKDYIDAFTKNKPNILKESKIIQNTDFNNYSIIGVLVGADIDDNVKKELNGGLDKFNIFGLTINRYKTTDSRENFILTELYESTKGVFIRYDNWNQFEENQRKRNIPQEILKIANRIHDDFLKEFKLTVNNVKYARTVLTLNVPKKQRRRVFAYIIIRKKGIKIYLHNDGTCPPGSIPHEDLNRYPNEHYVLIDNMDSYNEAIKEIIRESYKSVFRLYGNDGTAENNS